MAAASRERNSSGSSPVGAVKPREGSSFSNTRVSGSELDEDHQGSKNIRDSTATESMSSP